MNTPTIRRTQARPSLRENKSQQISRKQSQQARSRSPEPRSPSTSNFRPQATSSVITPAYKKKKKSYNPSLTASVVSNVNHVRQNQNLIEDESLPFSRRLKSKSKAGPLSRQDSGQDSFERGRQLSGGGRKDHERSQSGERQWLAKNVPGYESDEHAQATYGGPLAVAEFARLRTEVEKLKDQLSHSKKTIHKQSKVIDELRHDFNNVNKTNRENMSEIASLKGKSKKADELLCTIETSLQCQICMEPLSRPFGLSPCGHILCQGCLQSWFRAAPPAEDEMYDEDDPMALVYRRKTCPCCRGPVKTRPIPLFLVKGLVSVFSKSKSPGSPGNSSPPPEQDPWAGIFFEQDESMSTDEDDEDDDDVYDWSTYDDDLGGYGTESDDESYDGEYTHATWQPPTCYIDPEDHPYDDLNEDDFRMLRRGATVQMIELFSMQYSHEEGLSIVVDNNHIHLGWNINLHPDDETGEEFVDYIMHDIYHRRERWDVTDDLGESWTAWKLVPAEDEETFETTDSDAWEADDGDDDSD